MKPTKTLSLFKRTGGSRVSPPTRPQSHVGPSVTSVNWFIASGSANGCPFRNSFQWRDSHIDARTECGMVRGGDVQIVKANG